MRPAGCRWTSTTTLTCRRLRRSDTSPRRALDAGVEDTAPARPPRGPSGARRCCLRFLDHLVGRVGHVDRLVARSARLPGDVQQLARRDVGAAAAEVDPQVTAVIADRDDASGTPAPGDVVALLDASLHRAAMPGNQAVDRHHRGRWVRILITVDELVLPRGDAITDLLRTAGKALLEQIRKRLPDPRLHVIGHDRGCRVGHLADRARNLIGGAVMQ